MFGLAGDAFVTAAAQGAERASTFPQGVMQAAWLGDDEHLALIFYRSVAVARADDTETTMLWTDSHNVAAGTMGPQLLLP